MGEKTGEIYLSHSGFFDFTSSEFDVFAFMREKTAQLAELRLAGWLDSFLILSKTYINTIILIALSPHEIFPATNKNTAYRIENTEYHSDFRHNYKNIVRENSAVG